MRAGTGVVNGQNAYLDQTIIQRQISRDASGMVAYPFSSSNRLEFSGGYSQLSFDQQVRTVAVSLNTGRVISDETVTTPLGRHAAHGHGERGVRERSRPVRRHQPRGRSAGADRGVPHGGIAQLHLGARGLPALLHAGALLHHRACAACTTAGTGRTPKTSRLIPLFLGYPEFVRGYGINSLRRRANASPNQQSSCPSFERLVGSRMLVGNVEFRFPLLRPFGVTSGMYGPLPVEVAFFADGGVAWNKGERPTLGNSLADNARKPVSSAGLTLRDEPARLRRRADRLRAAVRSSWTGLGVGILADAGLLARPRRPGGRPIHTKRVSVTFT